MRGSTWILIFAGSGTRIGRSSSVRPVGGAICTGNTFSRSARSSPSARETRRPRPRNSAVSCPPIATTGTIGVSCSSESLANPVRPAKSIVPDSHVGR